MYTYEIITEDAVRILDPDGIEICWVYSVKDAEVLLTHLNRQDHA